MTPQQMLHNMFLAYYNSSNSNPKPGLYSLTRKFNTFTPCLHKDTHFCKHSLILFNPTNTLKVSSSKFNNITKHSHLFQCELLHALQNPKINKIAFFIMVEDPNAHLISGFISGSTIELYDPNSDNQRYYSLLQNGSPIPLYNRSRHSLLLLLSSLHNRKFRFKYRFGSKCLSRKSNLHHACGLYSSIFLLSRISGNGTRRTVNICKRLREDTQSLIFFLVILNNFYLSPSTSKQSLAAMFAFLRTYNSPFSNSHTNKSVFKPL
jgi:hypothetical protein